ncbi:MAG: RHS repeat-associated core domain-containing protein [Acidobacteria bacterium]|nr:RHS repeat-associated core domain-containing protein [Acidobacteriota bacterium]
MISATGRESAQGGDAAIEGKEPVYGNGFPITDQTLRKYTETYEYDSAGNFVTMNHVVNGDTVNTWTRGYECHPDSNRLRYTWRGSNRTGTQIEYLYDPHGNMRNLVRTTPEFYLRWDYRDMIANINLGGGGWAYYQYDAGKQRTRKYIKRNGDIEERIYLGGYELYRRKRAGRVVEEIESIHLFEGEQRVLLVDDVTIPNTASDPRPDGLIVQKQTLFRYQYSNHLGSACLELDHQAGIISCEEYHPYGTSAYRAVKSRIEAPPKRYRYTGMERDEESGLSYHGARYYAPWLGRWASCDPLKMLNLYMYSLNCPIRFYDLDGQVPRCEGMSACNFDPKNIDDWKRQQELITQKFGGNWWGLPDSTQEEWKSRFADQVAEEKYAVAGPQGWKENVVVTVGNAFNRLRQTKVGVATGKAIDWTEEQVEVQTKSFDRAAGEAVSTGMLAADNRPLNPVNAYIAHNTFINAQNTVGPAIRGGVGAGVMVVMTAGDAKAGAELVDLVYAGVKRAGLKALRGGVWRRLGLEFEDVGMKGLRRTLKSKYLNYMDEQRDLVRVAKKAGEKFRALPEAVITNAEGDIIAIFDAKIGDISFEQGRVYIDNLVNPKTKKATGVLYYISPDGARPIPKALQKYADNMHVKIERLEVPWAPNYVPQK